MDEVPKWTFHKEDIQMVNKYHLTLVRIAIIKKKNSTNDKCWRGYGEKGNPPMLLVGMYICTATMENSVEVP